ncbi:hypothetical protein [Oscillibacter sp.]|nr:hypothetical protein [Oscillibacter sp.]
MEIEATSADRNLLLEMKGSWTTTGPEHLRELELSIDAALPKNWCWTWRA